MKCCRGNTNRKTICISKTYCNAAWFTTNSHGLNYDELWMTVVESKQPNTSPLEQPLVIKLLMQHAEVKQRENMLPFFNDI
jgi:hypothetical protein